MQTTTLMMSFLTAIGDKYTLTLDEPDANLTTTDVKEAMDSIILDGTLTGKNSAKLTGIHSAQIVVRTVSALDVDY